MAIAGTGAGGEVAVAPALGQRPAGRSPARVSRLPDAPSQPTVPPEASTDAALVLRAADGDAQALGALYDRHGDAVYALCLAIVREPSDAEDAVAATFAQLWRHAARFDASRGSVGAWITMTARTRALDLLRARQRRARVVERAAADDADGLALPVGGSGDAPDAGVERAELSHAVRTSLGALPAPQRQAIELAFFGGLTHGEVADALGQPLGTVKTRIRDGLRKLRGSLAGLRPEGTA
jgi:RNA polymerase sigma-70 factor (ECF subfamily)